MGSLKGKKILITAGPTWMPVDDVRVLSNISTGELGIYLAGQGLKSGAKVDLLLGPVGRVLLPAGIRVVRFRFFGEFERLVLDHLRRRRYDIILHAAAVSDYYARKTSGKISSGRGNLVLRLTRAPKIVRAMRRLALDSVLVIFKLESGISDAALRARAFRAQRACGADLAVANTFSVDGGYRGTVLDGRRVLTPGLSKSLLARRLFEILEEKAT